MYKNLYLLVERCHLASVSPRVLDIRVTVEAAEFPETAIAGRHTTQLHVVNAESQKICTK